MGAKRNQRGRESAPASSQERRSSPASPASHLYSLPLKKAPTFSLLQPMDRKAHKTGVREHLNLSLSLGKPFSLKCPHNEGSNQ